jgi:hypothetical protein
MPMAGRDRIKLYIVIGLSVLFVLVGYFRFFHGKIALPAFDQRIMGGLPAQVAVPVLDTKGLPPEPKAVEMAPEPVVAKLRDIFAPWKEPIVETAQPAASAAQVAPVVAAEQPKASPSFTLTGTIVGGRIPLAFINGRSLRLGDKIEGFQIVTITREQVTLLGEGQKVQLNVLKEAENTQQ